MLGANRIAKERKLKISAAVAANNKKRPITASKRAAVAVKTKMAEKEQPKSMYCRYCCKVLPMTNFMKTTNPYIDKNGKMSICTMCVQEILSKYDISYNNDKHRSVYLTCQDVDLRYDEAMVIDTIDYFNNTKNSVYSFMTKYKTAIHRKYKDVGVRFRDTKIETDFENSVSARITDIEKDRRIQWGVFTDEEYEYLESKYAEYETEFGANTASEKDAFKTLVLLYLRQRNNPTDKDVAAAIGTQLTRCGVSPEQIKKEKTQIGAKTVGIDISVFELTEPLQFMPEWEKETGRFKDYDGIKSDLRDINRNIANFFGGGRDFSTSEVDISLITNGEDNEGFEDV